MRRFELLAAERAVVLLVLGELGLHAVKVVLEAGNVGIAAVYLVFEGFALGGLAVFFHAVVAKIVGVRFSMMAVVVSIAERRGGEFEEGGGLGPDGLGGGGRGRFFGRAGLG